MSSIRSKCAYQRKQGHQHSDDNAERSDSIVRINPKRNYVTKRRIVLHEHERPVKESGKTGDDKGVTLLRSWHRFSSSLHGKFFEPPLFQELVPRVYSNRTTATAIAMSMTTV